jgi:hypothetical protein
VRGKTSNVLEDFIQREVMRDTKKRGGHKENTSVEGSSWYEKLT